MPSHQELPAVQDHLKAYGAEINALIRPNADTRSGAGYDIFGGTSAVLFTREATRDRDLFRAIYYDASTGDDVDVLIQDRYGTPRIAATRGPGTAVVQRATSGTAGSFLAGTRIAVVPSGAPASFIEVAADTAYSSSDVAATVPVQTSTQGASRPLSVNTTDGYMRFEDPIDDPSWIPVTLVIQSGTDRETDAQYKARNKTLRLSRRVGYAKSITDACVAAGAAQVALYASDALGDGDDFGISRCFVGFSSYTSTPELVRACRIAVDSVRVLGADLVVMGMNSANQPVKVTVRLWLPPTQRNQQTLASAAAAAVVEYFNSRQNAFAFRFSAMRGAVLRALRTDVQSVDFEVGVPAISEPVLTETTYAAAIDRIFTTPSQVTVTVLGPQ